MNILRSCFMGKNKKNTRPKGWVTLAAFATVLPLLMLLSVSLGAKLVSFSDLLVFLTGDRSSLSTATYNIIAYVRLPRTAAAILSGAAFAVSGAILQGVLGNNMASPNVVGVNSGAGIGAALCMLFAPSKAWVFPVGVFLGAFLTAMFVYTVAARNGVSKTNLVLTGLAIGSVLSAGINAISVLNPDILVGNSSFMMGGFAFVTAAQLRFAAPQIILGLIAATLLGYELNLLTLGEDLAATLGLRVKLYRFIFIALAALLAGAAVSFSGLLGFVGLLVPHIVRMLAGSDNRFVIPCCALGGGGFVLLCDLLTRIIFAPYEFPVGIIMSLIGGPFFLWLLSQRRKNRYA